MLKYFRTAKHTRYPRAGMGGGADEVEVGDVFALVVKTEVGGLSEGRLDRETRAVQGRKLVAEMLGRDEEFFDDVLAQFRQCHALQIRHDQVAIFRADQFPV